MSPRQQSYEFHAQEQRTLLGFGVFYKDKFNKIQCINIDLVSNIQTQTGHDSVNSFR